MTDKSLKSLLTPQQIEVADLIAGGYTNAEIAKKIGSTEDAVKSHASRIYVRLNVRNRVQFTRVW